MRVVFRDKWGKVEDGFGECGSLGGFGFSSSADFWFVHVVLDVDLLHGVHLRHVIRLPEIGLGVSQFVLFIFDDGGYGVVNLNMGTFGSVAGQTWAVSLPLVWVRSRLFIRGQVRGLGSLIDGVVREALDFLLSLLDLVRLPGKPDVGQVGQHHVVILSPDAPDLVSVPEEVILLPADVVFVSFQFQCKVGNRARVVSLGASSPGNPVM